MGPLFPIIYLRRNTNVAASRLGVRYKGRSMPYRTFDKLRRVTETAVLENKRPGGLLTLIRESQQSEPPGLRTSKGPKRRDQTRHLFSVR